MEEFTVRVGSTDPLIFRLETIDPDTNEPGAYSLAGITAATLRLQSQAAAVTTYTMLAGELAVTDAAGGEITFSPTAVLPAAGNYTGYIAVTTATGKTIHFPSDEEFSLHVRVAF